jgi:flagellar biosynthesis protein FlhB
MSDKSSKTEKPTQRQLEKSRKEGQFPSSKQFLGAVQFLAFVLLVSYWGQRWLQQLAQDTRVVLIRAFSERLKSEALIPLLGDLIWRNFASLTAAAALLTGLALGFQLALTKMGLSPQKVMPDLKRLNPAARLRDLPRQNIKDLLQAAIMLPVFGAAVYFIAKENIEKHFDLPLRGLTGGLSQVGASLMDLLWRCSGVFLAFGCVDLVREKLRNAKQLRMTKQEVKEELKELEGNPQMKARIRRLARERLRRRMMSEIPKATAVIVNPTHYAVAIRYDMNSMGVPVVLAKGKNYLAQRIRQRALEHQIPLVENPPLAQALYKLAEVGQEIPAQLYRAVAEVLAYIFRLMDGRLPAA